MDELGKVRHDDVLAQVLVDIVDHKTDRRLARALFVLLPQLLQHRRGDGRGLLLPEPLEQGAQDPVQFPVVDGLEHIIRAAQLQGLAHVFIFRVAGDEHALHGGIVGLDPLEQLQTAAPGHFNVTEHDLNALLREKLLGLRHGIGGKDLLKAVFCPVHAPPQGVQGHSLVVDENDIHALASVVCSVSRLCSAGRSIVTRVPPPSRAASITLPWPL